MAPSLANMINLSFQNSQFPDILKVAKSFPIHKSGAKMIPQTTCLFRFSQLFPKASKNIIITKHLFGFLNKYRLLHKAQSGFRQRHSWSTALINLVDKCLKCIDRGEIVGALFFDL